MTSNLFILFIVSCYWQKGQSANYQTSGEIDTKNRIGSIRYLNKLVEITPKNYIGGPQLHNFGGKTGKNGNDHKIEDNFEEFTDYNDDRGIFEKKGVEFEFDAGNPDINGKIKRPCQVYDTFCIRKFFAEHSNCKISGREVPDPLVQAQGTVNFAHLNITEVHTNAVYRGLNNARVSEFYINEVTDNLVIAITLNNASKTINNGYFKYHLRGREPVVTRGFIAIQYGVLTVTVIIPDLRNLRLERAEIYTYGDTDIYPFVLGPSIAESTDPEVLAMFASFYVNTPLDYQEEISNQGNFMVGNYIQYNICDFGLKNL